MKDGKAEGKRMLVSPLDGTYCAEQAAKWHLLAELWHRLFGRSVGYRCGHSSKRVVLRTVCGKPHALWLCGEMKPEETLCPECTVAAHEADARRRIESARATVSEKIAAATKAAAEKTMRIILEKPEVAASPEKTREIRDIHRKHFGT